MRSQSRLLAALGLFALASFLPLGCGDLTAMRTAKPSGPAWTEEQWPKLLADVRAKIGENARLLRVEADYRSATFRAQDPKKPENVDAWRLEKGVLVGPIPVQLIGDGELEPSLFTWSDVALDKIPELAKTALERLSLESGEVVGIDVQRHFDPTLEIRAKANQMREKMERDMREAGASASTWKDDDLDQAIRENGQVRIQITVRGDRKMGGLTANAQGEVTDVKTY